jgi:hypothetical protein
MVGLSIRLHGISMEKSSGQQADGVSVLQVSTILPLGDGLQIRSKAMRLPHVVITLFAAGALVATSNLGATTLSALTTDELFQQAQLVVLGVVAAVEYRNSDTDSSHPMSLPHAFVTIDIEHTYKGNAPSGNVITLRFQGGPDGKGNALLIPGVPLFDVGDRDVLFIRGNGRQIAPLVGWQQGRFRIVNDLVYGDAGEAVWLTQSGKLVPGKKQPLEAVTTHNLGGTPLRFGYEGGAREWEPPAGAKRMTATRFANFIRAKVRRLTPRSLAPEPNLNIQEPFFAEVPEPVPPPSNTESGP